MPSSFARHEDLDAYLVEQKRDNFEKLDADSFESLQLSYLHFHGDDVPQTNLPSLSSSWCV